MIFNKACEDSDCVICSGSGEQKCTVCKAGFYLTGAKECVGCGGTRYNGLNKCTKCTADNLCAACENPYFANSKNICQKCVAGKYALPSTTQTSDCKSIIHSLKSLIYLTECSDSDCAVCSGPGTGTGTGKCTFCSESYITEDGRCKKCAIGKYLKGLAPYTSEDCTDCPEGCSECGIETGQYCINCLAGFYWDEGTCRQCPIGYSSPAGIRSASLCFKCADSNCEHCSGQGTGKCTQCTENFYWNGKNCVACADGLFSPPGSTSKDACGGSSDPGCEYYTGWDYARCHTCKAGYYHTDEKCQSCGEGKSSIVGSYYAGQCYKCEDSGCSLCFNRGLGKCSKCKKGFYLTDENTCKLCEVENCKACSSTGGCATCTTGFYVADDETCKTCEDENCKACGGPNIGRCTSCESGFDLVSGTCQVPAEPLKTNNLVSATIRYDMKMAQFDEEGGKNFFIAKTSHVLGVDIGQVTVSNVKQGSVIVEYEVALSGDNIAAKNLKKAMDKATGDMEFFKNGKVLNYDSNVGPRQTDDEGSGSKVGIIIGVVAGVVGVGCVIAAIVIWKKVAKKKAQKKIDEKYKSSQVAAPANDPTVEVIKVEQESE